MTETTTQRIIRIANEINDICPIGFSKTENDLRRLKTMADLLEQAFHNLDWKETVHGLNDGEKQWIRDFKAFQEQK